MIFDANNKTFAILARCGKFTQCVRLELEMRLNNVKNRELYRQCRNGLNGR